MQSVNVLVQFLDSKPFHTPITIVDKLFEDRIDIALPAYIIANKYCCFELANAIADVFWMHESSFFVAVTDLELLREAGLENDHFHEFMLKKLAYDLQQDGLMNYNATAGYNIGEQLMKLPKTWLALTEALCVRWRKDTDQFTEC